MAKEVFSGTVQAAGLKARATRNALKLSQEEVAKRAGVSRKFVSEFEHGHSRAEFGKVVSVLEALNVKLAMIDTKRPKGLTSTNLHEHVKNINVDSPLARRRLQRRTETTTN